MIAQTSVKIDNEQYEHLKRIRQSFGVPVAVQVRRAIRDYLEGAQPLTSRVVEDTAVSQEEGE